jgi:hypothetical protein
VTFTVVPLKPHRVPAVDPVAALPGAEVRILAGAQCVRDAALTWTVLLTFNSVGGGETAVRVLQDLAVTIGRAEARAGASGKPALFVHGPLPRLQADPMRAQIWHIAAELPLKNWPNTGSTFREP